MKKNIKMQYEDFALVIALLIYSIYNNHFNFLNKVGILLFIPPFVCWIYSIIQLGDAFSVKPIAKFISKEGFYKKLRHPIYIFSSLTGISILISLQKLYLVPIFLGLIVVQIIRARAEEKILTKKFGEDYNTYKISTWF